MDAFGRFEDCFGCDGVPECVFGDLLLGLELGFGDDAHLRKGAGEDVADGFDVDALGGYVGAYGVDVGCDEVAGVFGE